MDYSFDGWGNLIVTPSSESSAGDFDFLQGEWRIENRKLAQRLCGSEEWLAFDATGTMNKILSGLGNIDSFITVLDDKPFEGMSLRLFNLDTKLWSIYWADSNRGALGPPVTGSFAGDKGNFYTFEYFQKRKVLLKFNWNKQDPDKPVWSQAYSVDEGTTWEWNWYMYFHRT